MKVITTNLLNRFWKNGVKPIKEAVTGKLDASKVVNSLLATEEGFALDATQGKALKDQVDELNRKLPVCNEIYSGVANHTQYDILDITPYDLLVIYGGPGTYANTSMVVPVASIVHKDDGQFAFGVYQSSTIFWELEFNFPSNVKINIANYKNQSWTTPAIRKIVGVKL